MRYLSAEEAVLGITHQEVGQILANRWNLPEALGDTIAHHHRPSDSQDNKIVTSIIHLADIMTQRLGHGSFDWDDSMELDEGVIQILNLGNEVNLNKFIESHEVLFREQEEALIL